VKAKQARHRSGTLSYARALVVAASLGLAGTASAASPDLEQARALAARGDFAAARRLAEKAAASADKASPDRGDALFALAGYLERLGDSAGALARYREALEAWTKTLGADHPNVGGALVSIASLLEAGGRPAESLPLRQRALVIIEKALGRSHAFTGTALHNLGRSQLLNGDLKGAEKTFLEAFQIRNAAQGSNHPDVAQTLAALATVYRELGDLEQSRRRAEAALVIYQSAGRHDPGGVGNALENLGAVAFERGDYPRAVEYFKNAMGAYAAAFGNDSYEAGLAANNLAEVFTAMGQYKEAEQGFQAALQVLAGRLGADHPDVAMVRTNLAGLLEQIGNFPAAEAVVRPAIDIYEKRLGKDHPDLAKALTVLAKALRMKQDLAGAEPLLVRVEAMERKRAPNTASHASSLTSLGALYAERDEPRKSSEYFTRALDIYQRIYGPSHPAVADMFTSLGSADARAGNYESAERAYTRALAINEQSLGQEHPDVAADLLNLAGVKIAQGKKADAAALLERAGNLRDKYLTTMLVSGSESERRAVYASLFTESQFAFSLHFENALDDAAFGRLGYQTLLRRKGRLVEELAADVALARSSADPAVAATLGKLSRARSALAQSLLDPGHKAETETRLRADILVAERELAGQSALDRGRAQPVEIATIAQSLPEGTALVEYVKYYPFDFKARKASTVWGKPQYGAYVLNHDGALSWVKLGAAETIDPALDALRKKIRTRTSDPRAESRRVDELVFQPVRAKLPKVRELFVSTDGMLGVLPFAALVDEQGHYAVERFLFSFVGSGRDLAKMQRKSAASSEPIVLGNPAYDFEGAPAEPAVAGERSLTLTEDVFSPLPGTQREAEAVASKLAGAKLVTGREASSALLSGLHAPSVLHIATHGFFVTRKPQAPAPSGQALLGSMLPTVDDPFVRSGLALAGANSRAHGDDGLLSAYEAASLDLNGTRLVVLSACETGLGEIVDGLEVQGLGRAFSIAGAESVVMSLWKVDDDATRQLMTGYYERLAAGGGRGESLRDVQRDFVADPKLAHPYFWAAFQLNGDSRALSGERVAADVDGTGPEHMARAEPGARGCGCRTFPISDAPPLWLTLPLLALTAARRRRKRS
jgi:MYXO-CTERM domain-containing protein